ncbi:MAG TPA: hypothetical protein VKX39_06880 [Bryobacteraceae bacterium]|jgi:hypothetical protein|nr:hypothetical protein [Bryobacteraceae bacterium]
MKRAALFAAAPALCLLLFRRLLFSWFLGDDFAWLGKPLEIEGWRDLPRAIFAPEAQGTVRVLSERLFFLIFTPLFGLNAPPYRVIEFATFFSCLTLANLILAKLTGSRAAGLIGAILWASSVNLAYSLARVSAYNQLLYSLCILLAFYARLRWLESGERKWRITEWTAYLAGFGALEIVMVYPLIAALHALLFARKKLKSTLPLFLPAAIFAVIDYFFIPKTAGEYYAISVDQRLFKTFLRYLSWSLGPADLGRWLRHGRWPAILGLSLIAIALFVFSLNRLRRRDFLPLFFLGWFLILIAPVLPLPKHVFDYYVTLPELGLAWLGGWAAAAGIRASPALRGITIFLAAAWLAGSALAIEGSTRWFRDHSSDVRALVLGLRDAARKSPGSTYFLVDVDQTLFQLGVEDNPFRLFGLKQVYLFPGEETKIHARPELGGAARWASSPQSALHAIQQSRGRVFRVSNGQLRDMTIAYEAMLFADPRATRIDFIDAGDPSYADQLGPTWYRAEGGMRWMPGSAAVRLSGPTAPGERLYVTGYVPPAIVADGPVTLAFSAAGEKIGEGKISRDGPFAFDFPLPSSAVGRKELEIAIQTSRVVRPAADPRDFGAVFGTFAIR